MPFSSIGDPLGSSEDEPKGLLSVVGIGPGDMLDRTHRATLAIIKADVVAGYWTYTEQVADLTKGKHVVASRAREESVWCAEAVRLAAAGKRVALVSGGDGGLYGTAGIALEMAAGLEDAFAVEIIPGVTVAVDMAARVGAPLNQDCAFINLNDHYLSWERIEKRVEAVAAADMALVFYNPRTGERARPFAASVEILLRHRDPATPVVIASDLHGEHERIRHTTLGALGRERFVARSVVFVGDSTTTRLGDWLVTPRRFQP